MLDQSLQAVADRTRRGILQRLAHGHATVGQLAALFPISRPAVSQHLKVLKDAGLVRASGPGRLSSYELAPAPLLEIEQWARALADTWEGGPLPRAERPRQPGNNLPTTPAAKEMLR
jgi:DNA-binding transcriptional ArsR family regulator